MDATGAATYIAAPNKFLFDYEAAGLDGSGVISFDHKIFASGSGLICRLCYDHVIEHLGPGGADAATWTGDVPAVTNLMTPWVTVTAVLKSSDWNVTSGNSG